MTGYMNCDGHKPRLKNRFGLILSSGDLQTDYEDPSYSNTIQSFCDRMPWRASLYRMREPVRLSIDAEIYQDPEVK